MSRKIDVSDSLEDDWLMFQRKSEYFDKSTKFQLVIIFFHDFQVFLHYLFLCSDLYTNISPILFVEWSDMHLILRGLLPPICTCRTHDFHDSLVCLHLRNEVVRQVRISVFSHAMNSIYIKLLVVWNNIIDCQSYWLHSRINPVQSNLVHWWTGEDGWHNFHHWFPWDYALLRLCSFWFTGGSIFTKLYRFWHSFVRTVGRTRIVFQIEPIYDLFWIFSYLSKVSSCNIKYITWVLSFRNRAH